MFFFRGRRRRKLLASPLTSEQRQVMHRSAPLTARLPSERHEGIVQLLLQEKHFEGAAPLEVTDEMRLCIAGQAALLQLRADADYFPGLDTVLIYPDAFTVEGRHYDDAGLVTEVTDDLSGESWQQGVVVLAWSDVAHEAQSDDGCNVVLHEFAHQLDDQSGSADGTPLLPNSELIARWGPSFQDALETHRRRLKQNREVLFDEDSAESPSEFFATAVELFFEYPADLKREYSAVHAVLVEYLELDPADW